MKYRKKPSPYSSHSFLLQMAGSPKKENTTCLDVGCASGYLSFDLANNGWNVTGIDPQLPTNLIYQEGGIHFMRIGLFEFESSPFPLVIAGDVLEHIEDGRAAMNKLYELVSMQGNLLMSVPNAVNIYARLHILFGKFNYQEKGLFDETHLRFYTLSTLTNLIERSGFVVLEKRFTPLPAFIFLDEHLQWLNTPIMKILAVLARFLPKLFAYQFVFKVKKKI